MGLIDMQHISFAKKIVILKEIEIIFITFKEKSDNKNVFYRNSYFL